MGWLFYSNSDSLPLNLILFIVSLQVYVATVKLLPDSHLKELGLDKISVRAEIRRRCSESVQSKCPYTVKNDAWF